MYSEIAILTIIGTLLFSLIAETLFNILPVPEKIKKLSTIEERSIQFARYISAHTSFMHGTGAILYSSIYTVYNGGATYGQKSTFVQECLLTVKTPIKDLVQPILHDLWLYLRLLQRLQSSGVPSSPYIANGDDFRGPF